MEEIIGFGPTVGPLTFSPSAMGPFLFRHLWGFRPKYVIINDKGKPCDLEPRAIEGMITKSYVN